MNNKDIKELHGIGEKRAALFRKRGIRTLKDLLYFFPRTHEDRTEYKRIAEAKDGDEVCLRVFIYSPVSVIRVRANMTISQMTVVDDSGVLNVVWYNNRFVKGMYHADEEYVLFGKITRDKYGKRQMVAPIVEKAGKEHFTGKIVPIYPLSKNLTQKTVQSVMEMALKEAGTLDEYISEDIRDKYNISDINFAMQNIHFPDSAKSYNIARRRFVFEELFILQLALLSRKDIKDEKRGVTISDRECVSEFINSLPFKLTNAQSRTIDDVLTDFGKGTAMNRLVQGDVGSGKTAVAAAAIYVTVRNFYQAAMMAPTEILAQQHKETLDSFFDGMDINVVLLTGSMGAKEKRRAYEMIKSGEADVIVGTHALIQKELEFSNLALVVADEQHRFGVEQRAAILAKGNNPHMLIMSATPIPRTLALILYGDLDISVIDELPPNRKPVKTYAVGEKMRERIYAFLEKNVMAGAQAYVVCPLVEESEKTDLQDATRLFEELQRVFPKLSIGLMHGKMKSSEKDRIMNDFSAGKIQILVSTTVIEVGVNVPNANIMVVENAERFGLSQLHQLRGRVGRGNDQAYCILFAHGNNDITKKRMETMCISNDGFYISEQDLKLRGPGDFFGTRQHGLPEMRIANLFEDRDILMEAQNAAKEIIETDSDFKVHKELKKKIEELLDNQIIMN